MADRIRAVGWWIIGAVGLVAMIALFGVCQYGWGEVRDDLPGPVRSILGSGEGTFGEAERSAQEYMREIDDTLNAWIDEVVRCNEIRDQRCLTKAFEEGTKKLDTGIPLGASHLSADHARLVTAFETMTRIHQRAEEGEAPEALLGESQAALAELEDAIRAWYEEAE